MTYCIPFPLILHVNWDIVPPCFNLQTFIPAKVFVLHIM